MHVLLNFRGYTEGDDSILTGPTVYHLSRYLLEKGHTCTSLVEYSTTKGEFNLYSVDHSFEIGNRSTSDLYIQLSECLPEKECDNLGPIAKAAIDQFLTQFLTTPLKNPSPGKKFLNQCLGLYKLHVSKAADYGAGSITMTGLEGILTRTWDKMARLLHLSGYRYELIMKPRVPAKEPNNESVLDTWRDLAAYAIMALAHANRQEGENHDSHRF